MSMYDGQGANIYGNRLAGTLQPNGLPYAGYDPSINALMQMPQIGPRPSPFGLNGLPAGVVPYSSSQYMQQQPIIDGMSGSAARPGTLAAIAGNAGQPLQFPVQTRTVYAPPMYIQAPTTSSAPAPPPPLPIDPANITGGGADGGGGEGGGGEGGGFKDGGEVNPDHDYRRGSRLVHALPEGRVGGDGDGKADDHCAYVPRGAFIVPANIVASIGGGNTMAGAATLAKAMPPADDREKADMIPVRVSAGEFVIHPSHVVAIGNGDAQAGIAKLKQMLGPHA